MAAPLAGQIIRASDMFNLQSFTPTWTAVTQGAGAINEGWYQTIGDWVLFGARLEFGTAPSFSSTILMNLPVLAYTGGGAATNATVGSWMFRDNSGPTHYAGTMAMSSTAGDSTTFNGGWHVTNARPDGRISNSGPVPITLQVGDILSCTGSYRAA